jgi:hypothetical protein
MPDVRETKCTNLRFLQFGGNFDATFTKLEKKNQFLFNKIGCLSLATTKVFSG